MLVLSRKPGESLRIGPDVRITIVASSSSQVRLSIEAPDHVSILREEVYERVAHANLEAASMGSEALEPLTRARQRARGRESR